MDKNGSNQEQHDLDRVRSGTWRQISRKRARVLRRRGEDVFFRVSLNSYCWESSPNGAVKLRRSLNT